MDLELWGITLIITSLVIAFIRGHDDGKLGKTYKPLDAAMWLFATLFLIFGIQFFLIGVFNV